MKIDNRTCTAIVPPMKAGTSIQYRAEANDTLMNTLTASGNFTVKQYATLNITAPSTNVRIGENLTINGTLEGAAKNATVTLQLMNALVTQTYTASVLTNGTFTLEIAPNSTGTWALQGSFDGDNTTYPAFAEPLLLIVEEPPFLVKNGTLIGGAGFFAVVGSALAYYIKKRRQ